MSDGLGIGEPIDASFFERLATPMIREWGVVEEETDPLLLAVLDFTMNSDSGMTYGEAYPCPLCGGMVVTIREVGDVPTQGP